MSITVIQRETLRPEEFVSEWQGGETPASVIFVEAAPGDRVALHKHPYAELFFVIDGTPTFFDGDGSFEVAAGAFVVVSPEQPHGFANLGDAPVRQIDVHLSGAFETDWLED